jgi:hypothetical protein
LKNIVQLITALVVIFTLFTVCACSTQTNKGEESNATVSTKVIESKVTQPTTKKVEKTQPTTQEISTTQKPTKASQKKEKKKEEKKEKKKEEKKNEEKAPEQKVVEEVEATKPVEVEVEEENYNKIETYYNPTDLQYSGVLYWGGYKWTWYSERILPGYGLNIPYRHTDGDGFVCDGDGYICLASSDLSKGTVVSTPFGKMGKIYDCGCASGVLDVYVNW